jgi:hypothetical protein
MTNKDITAEEARGLLKPYAWEEIMNLIRYTAERGGNYVGGYDSRRWSIEHSRRLIDLGYQLEATENGLRIKW